MSLAQFTREQKLLAAAGACALFVISLFLPWYGAFGESVSATDSVASWWVLLLFGIAAAALLAAEAFNIQLPPFVRPIKLALYLSSVSLIVTLMYFLEGGGVGGREWGLFLALIFAIAALVLTAWIWREEV